MKRILKKNLLVCLLFLSACDYPAPEYVSSGDPERLIDRSVETVTFGLNSKKSLTKLSEMVREDRPSSADLGCSLKNARCAQAKEIFERNGVPIRLTGEQTNNVVLSYERVVARDCNPHFIDNMSGSRSFNHPSFGCAVAANIVQMVSDKHQFTNPNLLDLQDAEKANQSYRAYMQNVTSREVKAPGWDTISSGK